MVDQDTCRRSSASGARSGGSGRTIVAVPNPSRLVAGRELLAEFGRRLSVEERPSADLRALGCDWAEIAARQDGTAEGCRKQLARAIDRVALQLEGGEIGDD